MVVRGGDILDDHFLKHLIKTLFDCLQMHSCTPLDVLMACDAVRLGFKKKRNEMLNCALVSRYFCDQNERCIFTHA